MSIFKKIASLFSALVVEVPAAAATVDSKQAFADQQLAEIEEELEAKNIAVLDVQARLIAKAEAEAKKLQTGQALRATYRALDVAEDRLEVLQERLCHAEQSDCQAGDELVELAIRLRQERAERKLNRLGSAPRQQFIPAVSTPTPTPTLTPTPTPTPTLTPTPTPTPTPTSVPPVVADTIPTVAPVATVVPPVVTGTLPHSFNVSQKQ